MAARKKKDETKTQILMDGPNIRGLARARNKELEGNYKQRTKMEKNNEYGKKGDETDFALMTRRDIHVHINLHTRTYFRFCRIFCQNIYKMFLKKEERFNVTETLKSPIRVIQESTQLI